MRWISSASAISLSICSACLGDLGDADANQNMVSAATDAERAPQRDADAPASEPNDSLPGKAEVDDVAQGEPAELLPLAVAAGFSVNVFAQNTGDSRSLVAHEGYVYAARALEGDIVRFEDQDADGVAEREVRVAECFEGVHGLTFQNGQAFFATPASLFRADVDAAGDFSVPVALLKDLVSGGPRPKHGLASDGTALYLSTASSCDGCAEQQAERATVSRIALDGSSRSIYGRGLRNAIALAASPSRSQLWSLDTHTISGVTRVLELNAIEDGKNYGWPYCFGRGQVDLSMAQPAAETSDAFCAASASPALLTEVDAEPNALVFALPGALPGPYQEGAFVSLRGSRQDETASRVLFITFDASGPIAINDFASVSGPDLNSGLPVSLSGMTVADDGALLVADDVNGVIYRVHAI